MAIVLTATQVGWLGGGNKFIAWLITANAHRANVSSNQLPASSLWTSAAEGTICPITTHAASTHEITIRTNDSVAAPAA